MWLINYIFVTSEEATIDIRQLMSNSLKQQFTDRHSDTFWFRANQSLLVLPNVAYLPKKQQISILQFVVWPTIYYRTRCENANHHITDRFIDIFTFDEQLFWCKWHVQPPINQLIIQVTIFMLKNMEELFVFTNFTLYKTPIKQQHFIYVPIRLTFQISINRSVMWWFAFSHRVR
jgi:hypothetical protein